MRTARVADHPAPRFSMPATFVSDANHALRVGSGSVPRALAQLGPSLLPPAAAVHLTQSLPQNCTWGTSTIATMLMLAIPCINDREGGRLMEGFWCVGPLLLVLANVGLAQVNPSDEQRFRDLIARSLILTTAEESPHSNFQFEVLFQGSEGTSPHTYVRFVAERQGREAAAMLLSPRGFPTSWLTNQGIWVIDQGTVSLIKCNGFELDAVVPKPSGIFLHVAANFRPESGTRAQLDVASLMQVFVREGTRYEWDAANRRFCVTSPGGVQLMLYTRDTGSREDFPIQACTVNAADETGKPILQIAISNIHIGANISRSLLHPDLDEDPIEAEEMSIRQLYQSNFVSLGASFDESHAGSRKVGQELLRRFLPGTLADLAKEKTTSVQALLDRMDRAAPHELAPLLSSLRTEGETFCWGKVDYDAAQSPAVAAQNARLLSAGKTEIVLGPELTPRLRQTLAKVVDNPDLASDVRAEALDLLGEFGIPFWSPLTPRIERAVQAANDPAITATLATVRARLRAATEADMDLLHRMARAPDISPRLRTRVIEALALLGQLDWHASQMVGWTSAAIAETAPDGRRLWALALAPAGQAALVDMLNRASRPARVEMLTVLQETVQTDHASWPILAGVAQRIALDPLASIAERHAANLVVYGDMRLLTLNYSQRFYELAATTGDFELMKAAMINLVVAGDAQTCFRDTFARLAAADDQNRWQWAVMVRVLTDLQLRLNRELPTDLWEVLDRMVADKEAQVCSCGLATISMLSRKGVASPQSTIEALIQLGLRTEDPLLLAGTCTTLSKITGGKFQLSIRNDGTVGRLRWYAENRQAVQEQIHAWQKERQASSVLTAPGSGSE